MKAKVPTYWRRMTVSHYLRNQSSSGAQINFVSFEPHSITLKWLERNFFVIILHKMNATRLLFEVLATNLHVVEKWIKIGIQLHVTTNMHLNFQAHVYTQFRNHNQVFLAAIVFVLV